MYKITSFTLTCVGAREIDVFVTEYQDICEQQQRGKNLIELLNAKCKSENRTCHRGNDHRANRVYLDSGRGLDRSLCLDVCHRGVNPDLGLCRGAQPTNIGNR
jgi:hypothetical protein